ELRVEAGERATVEPGSDLPREAKRARRVVVSQEQSAETGPGRAGLREATDDQLLPVPALRLDPVPSASRAVRGSPELRDRSLEPAAAGLGVEVRSATDDVVAESNDVRPLGGRALQEARERPLPLLERNGDEGPALEVGHVEHEVHDRRRAARAHRVLEHLE